MEYIPRTAKKIYYNRPDISFGKILNSITANASKIKDITLFNENL